MFMEFMPYIVARDNNTNYGQSRCFYKTNKMPVLCSFRSTKNRWWSTTTYSGYTTFE